MGLKLISFLIGSLVTVLLSGRICAAAQERPLPAPPSPVIQPPDAVRGPFVDTDASPMTTEELVGIWSPFSTCRGPIVFRADGTYTDGNSSGTWSISESTLTQTSNGRMIHSYVNPLNANAYALSADATARLAAIFVRCRR